MEEHWGKTIASTGGQHAQPFDGTESSMLDSEGSRYIRRCRQSQVMQGLVSYDKDLGCFPVCNGKPLEVFK